MSNRMFDGPEGKRFREAAHLMVQQGKLPGPKSRFNERQSRAVMQSHLNNSLLSLCSRADVNPREVQYLLNQGADPNAKGPDGTAAEVLGKTLFRELVREPGRAQREIMDSLYVLERAGVDVSVVTNIENIVHVGLDELLIEHMRAVCEQGETLDRDYVRTLMERGANPNATIEGMTMTEYLEELVSAHEMAQEGPEDHEAEQKIQGIGEAKEFLASF